MGNTTSSLLVDPGPVGSAASRQFSEDYIRQPWRSEKSRELDALGGLERPAFARGQSMTAKLKFLQEHLQRQQREIQEVLAPLPPNPACPDAPGGPTQPRDSGNFPPHILLCDVRAATRVHQQALRRQESITNGTHSPQDPGPYLHSAGSGDSAQLGGFVQPKWQSLSPEVLLQRRQQQLLRQKMLAFAKGVAARRLGQDEDTNREEQRYGYGSRRRIQPVKEAPELPPMAPWRLKVHGARRRVMLIVLTVLRLQRGHRRRQRLRRDSFSWRIQLALGSEAQRFAEEQVAWNTAHQGLNTAKATLAMLSDHPSLPHTPAHSQLSASQRSPLPKPRRPGTCNSAAASPGSSSVTRSAVSPPEARMAPTAHVAADDRESEEHSTPPDVTTIWTRQHAVSCGLASAGTSLGGCSVTTGSAVSGHGSATLPSGSSSVVAAVRGVASASSVATTSIGGSSLHSSQGGSSAAVSVGGSSVGHRDAGAGLQRAAALTQCSTTVVRSADAAQDPAEQTPLLRTSSELIKLQSTATPTSTACPGAPRSPAPIGLHATSAGLASTVSVPLTSSSAAAPRPGSALRRSVGGPLQATAREGAQPRPPSRGPAAVRSSLALPPRVQSASRHPAAASAQSLRLTLPAAGAGQEAEADPGSRRGTHLSGPSAPSPVPPRSRGGLWTTRHPAHSKADLHQRIQAQVSQMQRSRDLMSMFLNRVNGAWAEGCSWSSASVLFPGGSPVEQQAFAASEQWRIYRADLTRKLRNGQVVWFFSTEDCLMPSVGTLGASNGRSVSSCLWTADPWQLLAALRPGSIPQGARRLEGLSLGGRALAQLVQAVETLAGPDAVAKLPVVLQVPSSQLESVKADMMAHQMYGLTPRNVFILESPKSPTYTWDPTERCFVRNQEGMGAGSAGGAADGPCDSSGPRSLGPGYAFMQCAWPGEALQLLPCNLEAVPSEAEALASPLFSPRPGFSRPASAFPTMVRSPRFSSFSSTAGANHQASRGPTEGGSRVTERVVDWHEQRLADSVWDVLTAAKAEWVVSFRSRDMALLGANGGPLDVNRLAYIMAMRDRCQVSMATMGLRANQVQARQADSVLLCQTDPPKPAAQPVAVSGSSVHKTAAAGASSAGARVVELRCSELGGGSHMAELQATWAPASSSGDGSSEDSAASAAVAVGLQRYAFHLPSLVAATCNPGAFSPKLALSGGDVHVSHELSDLSRTLHCIPVAVSFHRPSGALTAAGPPSGGPAPNSDMPDIAEEVPVAAPTGPLPLLTSVDDLDELVPLLLHQDRQKWLRQWTICGRRRVPAPLLPAQTLQTAASLPASLRLASALAPAPVPALDRAVSVHVWAGYESSTPSAASSTGGSAAKQDTVPSVPSQDRRLLVKQESSPASFMLLDRQQSPEPAEEHDPTHPSPRLSFLQPETPSVPVRRQPPNNMVVFLVNNKLGHKAVNLVATIARPQDCVTLVTVVTREEHEGEARSLLQGFEEELMSHNVCARALVLVKGSRGLLDCMQDAVDTCQATLAIMCSKALTSGPSPTTSGPNPTKQGPAGLPACEALAPYVVGSVTLSAIKRLSVPVAVVTTNTKNLNTAHRNSVSAVALVEPQSRPMLHYLASHCLDCLRGDRLLLVQQGNHSAMTMQQAQQKRRLMESFNDIANNHHLPPIHQLQLSGDVHGKEMGELLVSQGVHLVGLQVAKGPSRLLTLPVLQLLGSSPAAVLVFRENTGVQQA